MKITALTFTLISSLAAVSGTVHAANTQRVNGENHSGSPVNIIDSVSCQGNQIIDCEFLAQSYYQQATIFNLYYSSKRSSENKGLGLSIVRKIMLDHGGDIRCEPLATGAAFTLTLPLNRKNGKKS